MIFFITIKFNILNKSIRKHEKIKDNFDKKKLVRKCSKLNSFSWDLFFSVQHSEEVHHAFVDNDSNAKSFDHQ